MDKGNAILVNKYYHLPSNYAPDDIVEMSNWYSYPDNRIRKNVYMHLLKCLMRQKKMELL